MLILCVLEGKKRKFDSVGAAASVLGEQQEGQVSEGSHGNGRNSSETSESKVEDAEATADMRHCRYCSYTCYSKALLTAHLRAHSGDKSYQCPECDYR